MARTKKVYTETIKVALADDHLMIRKSMTMLINSFSGIEVLFDADNGAVLLEKLKTTYVNVVLLDIQMPVMNGYETCRELLSMYPNIKIVVVSQLTTKQSVHKIIEMGAHGYFTKNSDPYQLEEAIRNTHEDGYYFGTDLGNVIREAILWEKEKNEVKIIPLEVEFSSKELEVILSVCQGLTKKEIAAQLFVNHRTIDSHLRNIMEKMECHKMLDIVLYAIKRKLVSIDEI